MRTTRRRSGDSILWAQTAWARKRARFTLVISATLLLLGMGPPQCAKAQVESVIYSFSSSIGGPSDGHFPYAGLVRDSSGNLYGTTQYGGSSYACPAGCGTVFEMVYDSSLNSYTERVLYNFTDVDGSSPVAGLVMDSSGSLYGTTQGGGSWGLGVVFKLTPDSSSTTGYSEQVLYSFNEGSNAYSLHPTLVMDSSANLYGVTTFGGTSDAGTVFKLVYDSTTNSYTEQVLYNFTGGSDGHFPYAGLVIDSSGNLYGTVLRGGSSSNCTGGCGTVFKLDTYGTLTVLHSFSGGANDGAYPFADLLMDSSGNLYGTTGGGGPSPYCSEGCGTVFELVYNSTTNSYTEQVLYSFTGGSNAYSPQAGLVRDSSGNLYGTTPGGGSRGLGTVFELVYNSTTNSYTEQVLHSFTWGDVDGEYPYAGLVKDSSGNLYGTTAGGGYNSAAGTVFGIAPVTLSATSLDFGTVAVETPSPAQTVTITNIGSGSFSYNSALLSGANAADFTITSNTCSTAVAPGDTCSVNLSFTPNAASSELAMLNLSQGGMTQTVSLTGTGAFATANLSESSLTFPAQPVGATSSAQTVTVTNTSTVTLNITAVSITGDFAIASNTCSASVAAGQSCTVEVTFSPTMTGTRTGTLSFTDNAASSPQTVTLTGTGQDFSVGAQTASATISAGGTASFDLLISPAGGFIGDVSLTCSGAPSKSACAVTPASVTLNGTDSATVTLKVTTTAASGIAPPVLAPWDLPPLVVFWIGVFALLGLGLFGGFIPSRTRMRQALLASLATVLLVIAFWTACGGGSPPARSITPGTQPGTYTLTVTGASGGLSHSTTVSLTVR